MFSAALAMGLIADGRSDSHAAETFSSRGVQIHYEVRGSGEPVILIHGWLSSGWINWELPGIARQLARHNQVIWFDVPGHGQSAHPETSAAYGLELVEHVVRLMDRLQIRRAHLVGYSMGGIIAAKCASRHPERVRTVTLGGMGWLREGSLEQRVFAAGGRDNKPVGLCFRSLADLALSESEVRAIRTPVQVVFGEQDWLRRGYVEPLQKVRPDWPVVDIPGANHLTCLREPRFVEVLRKWLDHHRDH